MEERPPIWRVAEIILNKQSRTAYKGWGGLAFEKLKSHKSPAIDQIPAELIKAGGRTIRYQIHKCFISVWNKDELPEEWKQSITVPIYRKGDKTKHCSNYTAISLLTATYKISFCCQG